MEKIRDVNEQEKTPQWIRPNLENEKGEIKRAIKEFLGEEPTPENVQRLTKLLENSPLVDLSNEEWAVLENTDSFHNVAPGDIKGAERITDKYNEKLNHSRDFKALINAFLQGGNMEAPTLLKKKDKLHLVSGNTRLMIARGLNLKSKVVIGEID